LVAKRNYDDAEVLLSNMRQANAGQLYGFAAECALKSLLLASGYTSGLTPGDIDRRFYVHIDKLIKSIQTGVQSASGIRTGEISEDYPWVKIVMKPLRGKLTVPCEAEEITSLWSDADIIKILHPSLDQTYTVKLPPQHVNEGPEGVLTDLEGLGLMQRLTDGRIQIPDVYRIAFGLDRRGGVKPLK